MKVFIENILKRMDAEEQINISIRKYFERGGETYRIISVDRYRDGVECCGGTGTLCIDLMDPADKLFRVEFNGKDLVMNDTRKGVRTLPEWDFFSIYLMRRLERYVDHLKHEANHSAALFTGLAETLK